MDNELGPLLVAPASYLALRRAIREALGFPHERRPILIGVDGLDGAGKSSLAAWLSWQLEMPAIHLDLYIIRDSDPLSYFVDDLGRAINARLACSRPVIVEGVVLVEVLANIGRAPDFLVFVDKEHHQSTMTRHVAPYVAERQPREKANFVLEWSSAEHDRRLLDAAAQSSSRR